MEGGAFSFCLDTMDKGGKGLALTDMLNPKFERVLAHSSDDQLPTTLPPVESCAPGRDTADGEESFGLAPGAGSRSYMQ